MDFIETALWIFVFCVFYTDSASWFVRSYRSFAQLVTVPRKYSTFLESLLHVKKINQIDETVLNLNAKLTRRKVNTAPHVYFTFGEILLQRDLPSLFVV